jgi:hypothetical protein
MLQACLTAAQALSGRTALGAEVPPPTFEHRGQTMASDEINLNTQAHFMKKTGFMVAALAAAALYSSTAVAAITASFTPNKVFAGQSTTFAWQSPGFCEVEGLPGGLHYGRTGSYTFTAQTSLSATIHCEVNDVSQVAVVDLTIIDPNPTMTAFFSPTSVYAGSSSTLTWGSTNVTNCTSLQNAAVNGPSGSVPAPTAIAGTQTTTITCTGPLGSVSKSVTLTALPPPIPRPIVQVIASPSSIWNHTWVSFYWNSIGADGCNRGLFGSTREWVTTSTYYGVTCWNAGGYTTSYAYVRHYGFVYGVAAKSDTSMLDASKRAKVASTTPDLKHLGIDLSRKRLKFVQSDLNNDGMQDVVVVDAMKQTAYIIIGKDAKYPSIDKTVTGVSTHSQIKEIFVPLRGANDIVRVTLENKQ